MGISLGASTVIFAASHEPTIKAIWAESSLAIFDMILSDEISRYGFPNIFGPVVSLFGQFLTGIDPSDLNPAYALKKYPELGELFGLKLDCVDETQVDKTQVKEKTKTRKKKSKKKRRGRKKH